MVPSRMDRLVKVLRGEGNLPAKLPPSNTKVQKADEATQAIDLPKGDYDSLQSVMNNVKAGGEGGEDWWNATPSHPQPVQQTHARTKPTANSYTDQGETRFEFDRRRDEPAPLDMSFSPFVAITKFCYKFVKRDLQQPIATKFFDESKIWNREWDFYYIWSDYYQTAKPVTFVPEYQLLALINEINEAFTEAKISITDELREEGLVLNFDNIDRVDLRPRFLGHSTTRPQIEYWTTNMPFPPQVEGAMPTNDRSLAAFKEKMGLAAEISKNKKKATAKQRQAEYVVKRQNFVRMLLRAQRYLGLATKNEDSLLPDISKLSLSPIDVTQAAPHTFDSDVIYIAVDVEAFEEGARPITEVGVATLDTRDLSGHAPGTNAADWQQFIRPRHFRITEHKNLSNKKYLDGCPDKFEFGDSEFIGKDKICKAVADCFKQPYSGSSTGDSEVEKRNIILVGHEISQDISYLQKIGFSVANCANIIDTIDTATLFRAYTHDPNARSLGSIIYEFNFAGWNLHNAGNDAVYTLWAMLAICTKAASERGSAEAAQKQAENAKKRTEAAVEQAKARVKDELDGWDSPMEDDGVKIPPAPQGEPNRQYYTTGGNILDV